MFIEDNNLVLRIYQIYEELLRYLTSYIDMTHTPLKAASRMKVFDYFDGAIRAFRDEGYQTLEEVLTEMKSFWRHGFPNFVKKMCYISSLNITLQPYNALDFPQYINLCD